LRWPTVKFEIPGGADDFAVGSDELAGGLGHRFALLFEVGGKNCL